MNLLPAAYLGLTGAGENIWPVFRASNQLITALALMVISIYLAGIRRPSLYALIPGLSKGHVRPATDVVAKAAGE